MHRETLPGLKAGSHGRPVFLTYVACQTHEPIEVVDDGPRRSNCRTPQLAEELRLGKMRPLLAHRPRLRRDGIVVAGKPRV
jgi:hypothetical protein